VGAFKTGDVLYGKLRPYLKKAIVSDSDGICSTEFLVLQPKTVLAPWLHQWLLTTGVTQQIEAGCEGTKMPRADWEHVGSIHVPSPSASEQAEIIAVLDSETKRIDSLIAKKTRFIELLKEKRRALITHAVTKGLDPNVKMRDSGVEWIGDIPHGWSFEPIKFLARIGNGSTPTKDKEAYWENGHFPWLTSSCVNQDLVKSADQFVTHAALSECHLPVISPPAVLVGITGQGKTRGMASTLLIEATINQHIAFLKPKPQKLLVEYLRMFLDASYGWLRFESDAVGSTKGAITCEQLGNTKIPLPTLAAQQQILDQARNRLSRIDSLSEKTQHSIDLLKERRSAFITAAVTGQIDLREPA
jgi:type I restriction enzyme S subunit